MSIRECRLCGVYGPLMFDGRCICAHACAERAGEQARLLRGAISSHKQVIEGAGPINVADERSVEVALVKSAADEDLWASIEGRRR